ncbi:hypothetical protein KIW84_045439 [Lathyrus oleraceus]|uniref:Uncharacterized protein n=1 Tax=Pisum sativum TaxID=3888 RepID=A0A9D4XKE5_PEA|nr:hypothetical protein KIW84_045439 [Pisum sativum]
MSLSMLCGVPINCLYGYPVMDSVGSAIKHSTLHLGSTVVSGRRVVYTIITMRITYDTLHNFLYSILIAGQSGLTPTPTPSPNFEFPVFEAEEDDVEEIPDEITRLLEHEEKIIQPHLENLEIVNLGSEDCVREVKIGALLEESVKKGLIELLREYVDIFAWSYEDMPGLDTDIVQHFLPLKPECVPVKQKLRRTHPDMAVKIKEEVHKQIGTGFLVTSTYP